VRAGRITIAEVARQAGVSKATVSLVLNGRAGAVAISEATQSAVRDTAARLSYTPHRAARSLRSRRTHILTLLISTLVNPYFADIAAAAQAAAAGGGYELNIVDASSVQAKLRVLDHLRGGGSDGVIIATGYRSTRDAALEAVRDLIRRGMPAVLVLDRSPDGAIPALRIDNELGLHAATGHLIGLGHRRIGFLTVHGSYPPDEERTTKVDRCAGYRRALAEAGLPFAPARVYQGAVQDLATGRALAHALLAAPAPRPTAAVTFNDLLALGALRACYEAGARVPEDLALVGFGGIEPGRFAVPALSTMDHPRAALGRLAVETLFALLGGRPPEVVERMLPIELLVRESCGAGARVAGAPADVSRQGAGDTAGGAGRRGLHEGGEA
jgi:LacI family transcriptional regulator